jgi:hypothetical protein
VGISSGAALGVGFASTITGHAKSLESQEGAGSSVAKWLTVISAALGGFAGWGLGAIVEEVFSISSAGVTGFWIGFAIIGIPAAILFFGVGRLVNKHERTAFENEWVCLACDHRWVPDMKASSSAASARRQGTTDHRKS